MSAYLLGRSSEVLVQKFYRFEEYESAILEIGDRLGISLTSSARLNEGENKIAYRDVYSTKSRQIIQQFYQEDIDRFSYTF
jgi:hypothetical protein